MSESLGAEIGDQRSFRRGGGGGEDSLIDNAILSSDVRPSSHSLKMISSCHGNRPSRIFWTHTHTPVGTMRLEDSFFLFVVGADRPTDLEIECRESRYITRDESVPIFPDIREIRETRFASFVGEK